MALSRSFACELIDKIEKSILTSEGLMHLTNEELMLLLMEKVWARLPIFSFESDILEEVIERLREGCSEWERRRRIILQKKGGEKGDEESDSSL